MIGVHRAAGVRTDLSSGIVVGGALTERERDVLTLVGTGLTSREIARRLRVRPSTVDSQVSSACTKLRARTRAQAALIMAQVEQQPHSLVCPEESAPFPNIDAVEQRLLELLADGESLLHAAQAVHLSRRTATRRLARIRDALGVGTTREVLVLATALRRLPRRRVAAAGRAATSV
jgi:DNA-binding NarL/FixJ family response regulator